MIKKKLEIQVNGYGGSLHDYFMGKEEVDFSELKYGEKAEMWIIINMTKNTASRIFIRMTWKQPQNFSNKIN